MAVMTLEALEPRVLRWRYPSRGANARREGDGMTRPDGGAFKQAAFRQVSTGHVVRTGPFHDLSLLPDGEDANLDDWEAGFTDGCGSFFTRREAAAAIGVSGSLESRSYFAGDATPTLEAGHDQSWKHRRAA
jgi:hypothetical protein